MKRATKRAFKKALKVIAPLMLGAVVVVVSSMFSNKTAQTIEGPRSEMPVEAATTEDVKTPVVEPIPEDVLLIANPVSAKVPEEDPETLSDSAEEVVPEVEAEPETTTEETSEAEVQEAEVEEDVNTAETETVEAEVTEVEESDTETEVNAEAFPSDQGWQSYSVIGGGNYRNVLKYADLYAFIAQTKGMGSVSRNISSDKNSGRIKGTVNGMSFTAYGTRGQHTYPGTEAYSITLQNGATWASAQVYTGQENGKSWAWYYSPTRQMTILIIVDAEADLQQIVQESSI